MRHAMVLVALGRCAEAQTGPDEPRPGGAGSLEGGQTGQSGTAPPGCEELYPTVEVYPFDATTPLGFSGAEAMAAMVPFAATIHWSDGGVGALAGTVATYDDSAPPISYRRVDLDEECVPALTLRAAIELVTDDGRVDTTFVSNDLTLFDLGAARLGATGRSDDGWVDVSFLGLAPPATEAGGTDLSWLVEVDGAASTGVFRYFDRSAPDGGDWLDIGSW